MAEYQPPAGLLQLKKDLLASEAARREIGEAMPAPTAVAAGEAEIPDELRRRWDDACAESARLAVEINRHPWWDTVDSRHAADVALMELAKD